MLDGSSQLAEGSYIMERQNVSENNGAENDEDSAEDNEEVTQTSAPLVTCMQPSDLSQYVADREEEVIFNFAPGEGNKP